MYKNQFVGSRDFPEIKKQDEEKRKIKNGTAGRERVDALPSPATRVGGWLSLFLCGTVGRARGGEKRRGGKFFYFLLRVINLLPIFVLSKY